MDNSNDYSDYSEISDLGMERPHVVILGAGASLASFPNGDKNGHKLPLMDDLMSVCGLNSIIDRHSLTVSSNNFEDFYTELYEKGNPEILNEIENEVWDYFSAMQLPDEPTIYDMLVISLRSKDLIATFNWDPFLFQALTRNRHWIDMPKAGFLHGNTAVGYCIKDWIMGPKGSYCPKCGDPYDPAPLLYPVKQKNYQDNSLISAEWSKLKRYLDAAYMITIFGYSAPDTDVEAIKIMKEAYKARGSRALEQIEIIDIKSEDELRRTWSPFIVSHHYQICSNFQDSWIAHHPRRTCDTMWQQLMECRFLDSHHLPITDNWDMIREWYRPLIEVERAGLGQ